VVVELVPFLALGAEDWYAPLAASAGVHYVGWTNADPRDTVPPWAALPPGRRAALSTPAARAALAASGSAATADAGASFGHNAEWYGFWSNQDTVVDPGVFAALMERAVARLVA
jgi:hypothetical protein